MTRGPVTPEQHFTKPPPRYTEASLVRKMEELGIGRPSTYASILQVLQDRNYVVLEQRRFTPHDRGRMVVAFLAEFFERYVEYGFTADLENSLDDVSNGDMEWKALLSDFWKAFSAAIDETKELRITHVIDKLDAELGPHFFPEREDGSNPRKCLSCEDGRLGLKLGRNGGFIGCSNYPDCGYTTTLRVVTGDEDEDEVFTGPKELGTDPETGLPVSMRKGPFGVYVQLGEAEKGSKEKPKRQSLLRGMVPSDIDLELALTLLSLPRPVGPHPESGDMIVAGVSRFGPYLKVGDRYVKLGTDDDVLTVGLNRAVTIIAEAPARRGAAKTAGKVIGKHPEDGKPIELRDGRYGPYVKHGKINASLPRDLEPEALSLELAVELIAARAERLAQRKRPRKRQRKPRRPKQEGEEQGKDEIEICCQSPVRNAARLRRKRDRRHDTPPLSDKGHDTPFPTKQQVLEFVRERTGPVGKREIARAFNIRGADRTRLNDILRELRADGELDRGRGRRYGEPGTLPKVGVIEITGLDRDGDPVARPVNWDSDAPPPIYPALTRGEPAPAIGDRILARLSPAGDSSYSARTIKRLPSAPSRVLGIFRMVNGQGRIIPTNRRVRSEFIVPPGQENGASGGDLVEGQPVGGRSFGMPEARIAEVVGPTEGPGRRA